MLPGLEYVQETIELRSEDIRENPFETNNLLMDDILIALGYNKRRIPGVKAVYSDYADWEITVNGEKRFIIAVYGNKANKPTSDQLANSLNFINNEDFDFLVLTDGERLSIYNKDGNEITDIQSIFADEADEVLELISKDGYNAEALEDMTNTGNITKDTILEVLSSTNTLQYIIGELQIKATDKVIDTLSKELYNILNPTNTVENTDYTHQDESASNDELEETARELADAKNQIETLQSMIDSTNKQLEDATKSLEYANNELTNMQNIQNSSLQEAKAASQEEIDAANEKIITLENEISSLREVNENLQLNINDKTEKILALESEIEELRKQNENAEVTENSTVETNVDMERILADKDRELSDAIKALNTAEETIAELNEKLNSLNEANKQSEGYTESAYRTKIADLISANQKLTVELKESNDKLDEITRKQAGEEDQRVVMARQLLEAVEDNPDLNRTYVGVVNAKLFQIGELNKFVGICLQELYSVVSFDLMHLLFDGDIFKIIQPAVRGDLMINTRQYDIDLSELTEEDVLARLKTLFSKFENVVFMCKTIGNYHETQTVDDYSDLDSIPNLTYDMEAEEEELPVFDTAKDTAFKMHIDTEETNVEIEEDTSPLLGLALCDVGSVLWGDENPIITLEAIGNSSNTFRIDRDTTEEILTSGIMALMALSDDSLNALRNLKTKNLTEISSMISSTREDGMVEIKMTNYYTKVDTPQQAISLLIDIADIVGVDQTQVYMYFKADYNENSILSQNYIDRNAIDLSKTFDINEAEPCDNNIHCLLLGTANDEISSVPGMKEFKKLVIKNVVAVRTNYIRNSLRNLREVAIAITEMLMNTDSKEVDSIINTVNSTVKYSHNVIMNSDEEHSDKAFEIIVGDKQYFIDDIPGYIIADTLFTMHRILHNDNVIDMRIELDSTVYTAFKNGVITADCKEYLCGKLFVAAVDGRTKIISK